MSPMIFAESRYLPGTHLLLGASAGGGTTIAVGFPRFVKVIGSPVDETSLSNSRQCALNSVTDIVLIWSFYMTI